MIIVDCSQNLEVIAINCKFTGIEEADIYHLYYMKRGEHEERRS